ncbi:MAG: hypothetical protein BWX98_02131 [Candidatus Aminicenantes bacterium ADurb.Bin147]|nr:MAG: hypothetical protein BWX98_02131 [Candidatus Aminicenantes bacterium ADurb.Bin147]
MAEGHVRRRHVRGILDKGNIAGRAGLFRPVLQGHEDLGEAGKRPGDRQRQTGPVRISLQQAQGPDGDVGAVLGRHRPEKKHAGRPRPGRFLIGETAEIDARRDDDRPADRLADAFRRLQDIPAGEDGRELVERTGESGKAEAAGEKADRPPPARSAGLLTVPEVPFPNGQAVAVDIEAGGDAQALGQKRQRSRNQGQAKEEGRRGLESEDGFAKGGLVG